MAEIGVIASFISIAGAAAQLTRTLYVFGSTTSAAREHVDHIAKNVSFYSDVLELLVEQFDLSIPRKLSHWLRNCMTIAVTYLVVFEV